MRSGYDAHYHARVPTEPWSVHLGPGEHFDRRSLGGAGNLPALWARQWQAFPSAPQLRLVGVRDGEGGPGPAGWCLAGQLDEGTRRAALGLAGFGVRPGDRVLWSTGASLASLSAGLGALRLGAVVVPVNPAYTERELTHIVADVRPRLAVVDRPDQAGWIATATRGRTHSVDPGLRPLDGARSGRGEGAPPLDRAAPEDPAVIVYTSGTTGAPKGAVLSHGNLLAGAVSLRTAWGWGAEDRLVSALPLFHVHGLCVALFGALAAGGAVVLLDRFDPGAVLDAAGLHRASMFFGVPTMYHRVLQTGRARELAPLRLCVSGSAPLAPALWAGWYEQAGISVLERYGMTETLLTLSNPLRGERRPGTVGLPLPGVEVRIEPAHHDDPDGELLVRGPTVFAGYWERPAATEECLEDGWFRTGDVAGRDASGYYVIRGRRGDLIITGGHNVYPAEVEDVLLSHPGVLEVAVGATPSDEWGEAVTAWVVAAGDRPTSQELLAHAAERLAPYKRPRVVRFVDALPRNALGKVLRTELS
jgi:malonyl-CoA/methylmalonyl-CoA synthetase